MRLFQVCVWGGGLVAVRWELTRSQRKGMAITERKAWLFQSLPAMTVLGASAFYGSAMTPMRFFMWENGISPFLFTWENGISAFQISLFDLSPESFLEPYRYSFILGLRLSLWLS